MHYLIHLVAPKGEQLTPKMVEWLAQHGGDPLQPEAYIPVRKLKIKPLARALLRFDPTLIPEQGDDGAVLLRYPAPELDLALLIHERGVIVRFPWMGSLLAQIVLRICHTYIQFLYQRAGFWSYDPQLNLISYAGDFETVDEIAALMELWLPKLLDAPPGRE
jgi:hypothetical protein